MVSSGDPDDLEAKIQREADNALNWLNDNWMVCAGTKTKLLVIGLIDIFRSNFKLYNFFSVLTVLGLVKYIKVIYR